ncbi:hypothetical protein NP233_g3634 [Leucocoprinus birnbaumii]|uniref:Uncharacterized protein n=1 Tax=Leucocoprinus birnbaumii TaxID=56174 RepID=A0AAD5VW63_9AGAR|nr:hypothetical protein NP233_g3634 [Leucocoprinus birnbaumii]
MKRKAISGDTRHRRVRHRIGTRRSSSPASRLPPRALLTKQLPKFSVSRSSVTLPPKFSSAEAHIYLPSHLRAAGSSIVMVSSTVNARLVPLAFYSVSNSRESAGCPAAHDKHQIEHAIHNREHLIAEAKEAWKRKQDAAKDTTVVTDPEDPRFDLEKLIAKWEKSS